jgi:hypothetical protein
LEEERRMLQRWSFPYHALKTFIMNKVDTQQRLRELREWMKLHSLQAYWIPSEDAHQVSKVASFFHTLMLFSHNKMYIVGIWPA